MKKIVLSSILIGLITYCQATSLKEVVEKTLDNNADILSEKFNKEAFKKYYDEEKGDYYPTLDLTGYAEDSKTRSDRDIPPAGTIDPSTASKDGTNVSLQLEQVLYDGGRTPSEVEEFRHRYNANKFRSDRRVEEIVRESIDSYMSLVKSQELIDISKNSINLHDDYLKIAKEKEEISGEILESHQVNSKKHYVKDRLHEQNIARTQANTNFEKLTSQKIKGNICKPIINEKLIPNSLQKAIEDAVRSNSKILEAMEKIKEQRENLVQADAAFLPTLRFQWQTSWDNDLAYPENGKQDISRLRLIVDWNIFEGGKNMIAREREKLFLQEQQKILDNTTQEVIQEITSSYQNYFENKAKLENIKKYVDENRNIKDVYVKQLEDGTRTFIDILNAESEYFKSQLDAIDQEFEVYKLYFDLLMQRNMLTDSILMSQKQECSEFKSITPAKNINKQKKEKQAIDAGVLSVLGEGTPAPQGNNSSKPTNIDSQINDILNDKYVPQPEQNGNILNESNNTNIPNTPKQEDKLLSKLPKGNYTIQIAELGKDEDISRFIEKMKLDKEQIYTYNKAKTVQILYGSFDSMEDATNTINNLSQKVIENGAYINSVKKHTNILQKFKTLN